MAIDHIQQPIISADEAMRRLIEGNNRFLQGNARFPTVCKETLADLAGGSNRTRPFSGVLIRAFHRN